MRRLQLICLVTLLWSFLATKAISAVTFEERPAAAKTSSNETSLSTAFSLGDAEIELTVIQVISPVDQTIVKKGSANSSSDIDSNALNLNINKRYSDGLLTVIAAIDYNLLFPFHHFW